MGYQLSIEEKHELAQLEAEFLAEQAEKVSPCALARGYVHSGYRR